MKRKIDRQVMRDSNRALVLDLIRRSGPLARAEVARRTALGKPAVSAIVDELRREGVVREVGRGAAAAAGGRPPVLVEFDASSEAHLGIHIGVNTTTVAVADGLGRVLATRSRRTPVGSPARTMRSLRTLVERALPDAGVPAGRLGRAAVAVPGLIERASGVCTIAPNLGWRDVPIEAEASAALGLPVSAYNITHAAAVAEGRTGAAAGVRTFVWLYVGSGVGSAIVVDGDLMVGARGFSGEIGHCRVADGPRCGCGKLGCLEAVASGPAIARAGARAVRAARSARGRRTVLAGGAGLTAHDVVDAAAGGDAVAREVLAEAGARLGRGVSYLASILNPEMIVVGGRVALAGDLLLEPLRRALADDLLDAERVPVVQSSLAGRAELTGAVLLALEPPSHLVPRSAEPATAAAAVDEAV